MKISLKNKHKLFVEIVFLIRIRIVDCGSEYFRDQNPEPDPEASKNYNPDPQH